MSANATLITLVPRRVAGQADLHEEDERGLVRPLPADNHVSVHFPLLGPDLRPPASRGSLHMGPWAGHVQETHSDSPASPDQDSGWGTHAHRTGETRRHGGQVGRCSFTT